MSDIRFEEEEFETQFNGKTLLRILEQTKPHWKWVAGFLISIAITSILDSYFTYLSKEIVDQGIVAKDATALQSILIRYGILALVQAVSVFGFIYLAGVLGERIGYDLRQKTFNHLQELSLSYYNRTPIGWIISRVTSDVNRVANIATWGLLDVVWGITNIGTAVYFMMKINWKLALMVFAIIPVIIWIAAVFKKKIILEYRIVRKINSKITGAFNENITGVRVSKALRREKTNLDEFEILNGNMYNAGFRAAWLSALFLPVVQIISAVAVGTIIEYGGLQAQYGAITIGGIQAFVSYVTFMMWPIQDIARVYAELQNSIASAERIFSMIDAVPEVKDLPDAIDPGSLQGDIEFKDVSFHYSDDETLVLKNFNLKIKRGETLALVGATGGGKSTIANLMARFFEPTSGEILIGGRNYKEFSLQAIQSRIGIVLQTPHLFSGSIRENIRYGRLSATDEEVEQASILAGAHEFISLFENGYNEDVGESGGLLSVGQKQLISLARAILADPEIFIMDEATSSVDTLTEALIQKGMEVMMNNRTSIVIAHRLSTIKNADRILVIENGEISEMGNHNQLLKQRGHYYNLYTRQFRRELETARDPFLQKKAA
ncbi:MAG: ABC transporter ATP-binding protein [Anaerolineales bacterium]|nr:ABC transporter ATP-binding protein [Anaerolineales bacterium]